MDAAWQGAKRLSTGPSVFLVYRTSVFSWFISQLHVITSGSMSFGVPLPESESEFPSYSHYPQHPRGMFVPHSIVVHPPGGLSLGSGSLLVSIPVLPRALSLGIDIQSMKPRESPTPGNST